MRLANYTGRIVREPRRISNGRWRCGDGGSLGCSTIGIDNRRAITVGLCLTTEKTDEILALYFENGVQLAKNRDIDRNDISGLTSGLTGTWHQGRIGDMTYSVSQPDCKLLSSKAQ